MTKPATLLGTSLFIKIGDGAAEDESFAHPVMINTDRGLQFSTSGQEDYVYDPADPDAPAWADFYKTGMSLQVSGSGKLDLASLDDYFTWLASDDAKNAQIWFGGATAPHIDGGLKLTDFQVTGPGGTGRTTCTVSLTFRSHGALIFTAGT